jgi:AraC-like DNA-binding protein
MQYQETAPSADLKPWIVSHWRFAVDEHDPAEFEHVIVPDGTFSISFVKLLNGLSSPVSFAGPSTNAHRVPMRRGIDVVGVRLHPAASGPLLRIDARQLTGKIGSLALVAPEAAAVVDSIVQSDAAQSPNERLEAGVRKLTVEAAAPDKDVVSAVDELLASHGSIAVSRLAARTGLSSRQLRRKFAEHVGLSPKEFARLRRIRQACVLMLEQKGAELAAVSLAGGYSDQPHLTREFRGIFGSSPRLIEAYLRSIEHEVPGFRQR